MRAFEAIVDTTWAIEPGALRTIMSVAARESDPEAVAARLGRPLEASRNVTVREGVAIIPVTGPIFRRANLFTEISGATSIEVLAADLQRALDDPAVKAVLLDVDSPGGEVNGTGEFAGMVRKARQRKPIRAYVGGTGASGAYYIASAAEEVVVSPSAVVGSIGVVMVWRNHLREGEVELVSSQSPLKRATPETQEGRTELQRVVDALAGVFVRDVAQFRGVTEEQVLEQFGAGGLLVGEAAVAARMADRVGSFEDMVAELARSSFSAVPSSKSPVPEGGARAGGACAVPGSRFEVQERVRTTSPEGPGGGAEKCGGGFESGCGSGAISDRRGRRSPMEGEEQGVGREELESLRAEVARLREDAAGAQAETAALRAREARRDVESALAGKRFTHGPETLMLAPATRTVLTETLMGVETAQRQALLEALGGAQLAPVGVIAFEGQLPTGGGAGAGQTLTQADRMVIEDEARRKGVSTAEVEAEFRAVREERARQRDP